MARSIYPTMFLRPAYLSQEHPLPTKDGGILRTIRDACNYMTGMDKKRELRCHWQRACKLISRERGCTDRDESLR
jgi:hypothetical protein